MTKRFVYVLRNTEPRPRYYVGITADVAARLADHTRAVVHLEFSTACNALAFERYLKSGSGRALAKRHFG